MARDESKMTREEIEDHPDTLMCGACKEPFLPPICGPEVDGVPEREVNVVRVNGPMDEPIPICPWCHGRLISAGILKPLDHRPIEVQ